MQLHAVFQFMTMAQQQQQQQQQQLFGVAGNQSLYGGMMPALESAHPTATIRGDEKPKYGTTVAW